MRGLRYAGEIDSTGPFAGWAVVVAAYAGILLAWEVPLEVAYEQAILVARWLAAMAVPIGALTLWAARVFFDFRKERELNILDEFHSDAAAKYAEYRDVHLVPVILGCMAVVCFGGVGLVTTVRPSFTSVVGAAFLSLWLGSWFAFSFLYSIRQREDGFATDHRYRREIEKMGTK